MSENDTQPRTKPCQAMRTLHKRIMHSLALARPSQRCEGASDAPPTDADSSLASLAIT
jgi:hypothetical protein